MANAGAAAPARRAAAPAWRDPVRVAKPFVFAAACWPMARLAWAIAYDPVSLGANPAERILHETGDWCLQFLLITLAVTPLRRITGWNGAIKFRRMLGLFAFAYGVLHLAAYVAFDQYFDAAAILKDIVKRPFITVGFAALVLMTPLAVTSTRGWVLRLGGDRWSRLHKAVYAVTILGVVHYWWLVKRDITWPVIYALVLAVLLGWRLARRARPRPARQRA
ncbi:protein-methionine-sulfoxide reductase heme-binding subunit MsrQ [Alsobacter sp. R-9]